MHPEEEPQQPEGKDTKPVWKMSDQELLSQVILAVEGPERSYWTIRSKYPNIFDKLQVLNGVIPVLRDKSVTSNPEATSIQPTEQPTT